MTGGRGFHGICIGGFQSGRFLGAPENVVRYAVSRVPPLVPSQDQSPGPEEVAPVAYYRHVEFTFTKRRGDQVTSREVRGFWITGEHVHPHAAVLDALAEAYMTAKAATATERERCARIVERGLGRTNTAIARAIREGEPCEN